jgi:hypothetical protein
MAYVKLRAGALKVLTMSKYLLTSVLLVLLAGCSPTVRVEAPKEPIEINLNVKIEHHIRVQVDKELEGRSIPAGTCVSECVGHRPSRGQGAGRGG